MKKKKLEREKKKMSVGATPSPLGVGVIFLKEINNKLAFIIASSAWTLSKYSYNKKRRKFVNSILYFKE
jgi:hypothetical protein